VLLVHPTAHNTAVIHADFLITGKTLANLSARQTNWIIQSFHRPSHYHKHVT